MLTRTFNFVNDVETGLHGWRMKGRPDFDPAIQGFAVAHDALDHLQCETGHIAEEIAAFGAMYRIRFETGYFEFFHPRSSISHNPINLAYNLTDDFLRILIEDEPLKTIIPVTPVKHTLLDETLECYFKEFSEALVASVIKQTTELTETEWYARSWDYAEWKQAFSALQNKTNIAAWLRKGYISATRRFPDPYTAAFDVFHGIAKSVDELTPSATLGDVLKVHVNIKQNTCWVVHETEHGWRYN